MSRIGASRNDIVQEILRLTPRERECLLWSALGKRSKQIAAILGISQATVNEYIASAMKKLKADTRAQAAAIIVQAGSDAG